MSQSNRQDLERGIDTSMFGTRRSAMALLSSWICVADGHSDQPQPIQLLPLQSCQGEVNYGDRSWPLYAMYSKVTQEGDNKKAEHWQKALDGVLVFVSPHFTPKFLYTSIGNHRLAYSPPLLLHCLQSQSQTSSPVLRIPWPSTLRTFTSFFQTKAHIMDRHHPSWLNHQHSLPQHMPSG